jgi:hypothetical protein
MEQRRASGREGEAARKIATTLNVSDMQIGRDLGATNVAPTQENTSETKGAKSASATNVAPSLPDGERAGAIVKVGNSAACHHSPS